MLAFAKDITQDPPKHPEEEKNSELKEYMDYQRKLNHERIIYHSLDYAKNLLQDKIQMGAKDDLQKFLETSFSFSGFLIGAGGILQMLRKLINGHNSTNNWYRMNPFYHAVVYDAMRSFLNHYNGVILNTQKDAEVYDISEGVEIDFNDWVYLFFPDLDFHIGRELLANHYPFAKRNRAIEEKIEQGMQEGRSRKEALEAIQDYFEIEEATIRLLCGEKMGEKDMELFYTSVENPIYEYLTPQQEGNWGQMEGESLLEQAYYLGSNLKVWVWRKPEEAAMAMEELEKTVKSKSDLPN
tara:strand:- start:1064 stop:1954 length:891 start_codon:yes stop_codon:yes gene_type:complete